MQPTHLGLTFCCQAFGCSFPNPFLMAMPPLFPEWPYSACFIPMPSSVAEPSCFTFLSCADMTNTYSDTMNLGHNYSLSLEGWGQVHKGHGWTNRLLRMWGPGSRPQSDSDVGPCQQVSSLTSSFPFRCPQVSLPTHLRQALATGTAWRAFHPLTGN